MILLGVVIVFFPFFQVKGMDLAHLTLRSSYSRYGSRSRYALYPWAS